MESLLEKTSILRTYCANPAAPLGDFCTESLLEKTSILRTYCANSAAPLGDFCTECRTRGWPAESAFIPFVSFGDLDNNTFKGLTSLLSVEQEIQYDEHT
jgi:hypothetical protein